MRVLVTGGSGFIGGYVVEWLARRGVEPVVLDLVRPEGLAVEPLYHVADVRDPDSVAAAMDGCRVVVHLAGVLGTDLTVDSPVETVENNLIGTLRVLEEAKRQRARVVLINVGNDWDNPYTITKQAAVRFGLMYDREFGIPVTVVRAMNGYGPRQKADGTKKLVPTLICAALRGEPLPVYGDGEQEVDLVYVEDVAEILGRAALAPDPIHGEVQAATGQAMRVNEVAECIRQLVNPAVPIVHLPMRRGEPPRSRTVGSPAEAARYFGYVPATPLEEGLRRTVEWYRSRYGVTVGAAV
ncbi:MAG: NAD-dependent epimerase/dehydratase family protein [Armatimonadota bacterium]|nr:NAD-dependent epimerase/dehydratase family protein [Armatimonadota bacterium]